MITIAAQVIAVLHEGRAASKGNDLKSVARQLEVAGDLGAQQAGNIRAVGVVPTFMQLTADCGTTNVGIAF